MNNNQAAKIQMGEDTYMIGEFIFSFYKYQFIKDLWQIDSRSQILIQKFFSIFVVILGT